jgi:hypothetical protein
LSNKQKQTGDKMTWNIYEMDYSAHPQGVNEWSVQNEKSEEVATFLELGNAVAYAYEQNFNFTIHTLSAWHAKEGN